MRNLDLIDAVVALHDIARLVEAETGADMLAKTIRECADQLHALSIDDHHSSITADNFISKVKSLWQ